MTIEAKTFLSKCSSALLEAVYPTRCGLCGELGALPLCEACSSEFEFNPRRVEPAEGLDFRFGVYRYAGRAAQAVQRLKYARSTALGRPMADLLFAAGEALGLFEGVSVVPVPIHWSRRVSRGFNQSELLVERIPRGIVHPRWLRRVRATRPQAGLSLDDRQRNLDGAFQADPSVEGRVILLVDDVVTSGHTARACASALFEKGALEVGILAFAGNPDHEESDTAY